MDSQEFDEFLELTFADIRDTLASKGAEYVPGTAKISRFHNFQIGAGLNQATIEQVLWGFVTKHIVSLSDMVKKPASESKIEAWDEKIGDVINYMILLKAMVTYDERVRKTIKGLMNEEEVQEKKGFGSSGLSFTTDIPERREREDDPPAPDTSVMDFAIHTEPVNPNTSVVDISEQPAHGQAENPLWQPSNSVMGDDHIQSPKFTTIDKRPKGGTFDSISIDGGPPQTHFNSSAYLEANEEERLKHKKFMTRVTPPQSS